MHLKSTQGDINLSLLITTFLVCIIIAVGVAIFHSQYYPTKFLKYKSTDIADKFLGSRDFAVTAKNLLNSRNDLSYIKLLDQNGVLEESFGNDKASGTKKFVIIGPDNKSIIMGLKTTKSPLVDTYALIWSILIGSCLALVLISIISMKGSKHTKSLKKLEGALDRISQGDFTARVDVDSASDEEIYIINTYQSFNRMADSLNKKYKTEEITSEHIDEIKPDIKEIVGQDEEEISEEFIDEDKDLDTNDVTTDEIAGDESREVFMDSAEEDEEFDLKPESNEEDISDEADTQEIPEQQDYIEDELDESVIENNDLYDGEDVTPIEKYDSENGELRHDSEKHDDEPAQDIEKQSSFRPKIVLSQESLYPKFRNVSVIVAKINDFERLSEKLDTAELSSFLTEYRKSASQIITSYGGVIEALLQDEIVAIFNAPDKQNDAELKSICAAVEVLHELAGMTKKRRTEGKEMVTGKIGISMRALSYYSESGVPDSVKNVIKDARYICDNTNLWKVYVSSELYDEVKDFVDVKEYILDGEVLYSVTGVEQGVVQRENFS